MKERSKWNTISGLSNMKYIIPIVLASVAVYLVRDRKSVVGKLEFKRDLLIPVLIWIACAGLIVFELISN